MQKWKTNVFYLYNLLINRCLRIEEEKTEIDTKCRLYIMDSSMLEIMLGEMRIM